MTRAVVDFQRDRRRPGKGQGRADPGREVLDARSRFGTDVTHHARTGLVGRERELGLLHDALDRARYERIPQLVTIVGVPGIGKSRLVYELSHIADADPELITWRQGRCLAYGDGAAFWALAEIVKAQTGILEQDSEAVAGEKLRTTIADAIDDPGQARWVEAHLRPLIGLGADEGFGGDRRGEAFAAWRRALEAIAEQRPLVLVIEDLHWADDGLLDFVDELIGWSERRPVARHRHRPARAVGAPAGLGRRQAQRLRTGLYTVVGGPDGPFSSPTHWAGSICRTMSGGRCIERADGNPLYAEQFAQLYLEQGSAASGAHAGHARRDHQRPTRHVVDGGEGRAAGRRGHGQGLLDGRRKPSDEPGPFLLALARKGFLTRQRRSSVEHETEWSFAHMLIRDVSYGQIPRADRSTKHRRAAESMPSKDGRTTMRSCSLTTGGPPCGWRRRPASTRPC